MKRSLWLILAALILTACGVLLRYSPDELALALPDERQVPDVRIQHEFVRVSAESLVSAGATPARRAADLQSNPLPEGSDPILASQPAAVEPAPASVSAAAPTSPRTPVVERATNEDRTLFEKARRAFMGDGRFRPQPFPRVKED